MAPIDHVASGAGRIGMMACPGTGGRGLSADLAAIREWGAVIVVSLIEPHEFEALGVAGLGRRIEALGIHWHSLPIADMAAPDDRFETEWPDIRTQLHAMLDRGGSVLLHCRGGLGRTGTIAARLLVERGMGPEAAIETVRTARPGAIETPAQEAHIRAPRANHGPS